MSALYSAGSISKESPQAPMWGILTKQTVECALMISNYFGCGFHDGPWPGRGILDALCLSLTRLEKMPPTGLPSMDLFISTAAISDEAVHSAVSLSTLEHLGPCDIASTLHGECLPGTRQNIVQDIINWLTTRSEMGNTLWLCGTAGSGKSTIAKTISEYFSSLHRLGASLFFEKNKSNPQTVIPMMAYALARWNTRLESAICAAVGGNPGITRAPVEMQFDKLLLAPLLSVAIDIRGPIVIILDGLDECGDARSRQSLLSLFSNAFPKLPIIFRILVTSCPEPDIQDIFLPRPDVMKIHLEDTSSSSVADVQSYIIHRFRSIRSDRHLDPVWPGEEKIRSLTQHAAGRFIWASTATDFISDAPDPDYHLQTLIQHNPPGIFDVDELYSVVLANSGPWSDYTFRHDARAVLGAIVLESVEMTEEGLDTLLYGKKGRSTTRILKSLRCVLRWNGSDIVQTRHSSFGSYLTDHRRSGGRPWFIDFRVYNRILSLAYLRVLKDQLRFNICEIQDSHISDTDIQDLPSRIATNISPLLSYSSRVWASRLQMAGFDSDIFTEVKNFLNNRFLYWLEVLGLLKEVSLASDVLRGIREYARGHNDEAFEAFVVDAEIFVTEFATAIQRSVPHIYLSALPFTPRQSKVSQRYSSLFPRTLQCESPPGDEAQFPGHNNQISSLCFSSNGEEILSGSADATIRMWDAHTGEDLVQPYRGHRDWVIALALSPDSRHILSVSYDNTLRVWETHRKIIVRRWDLQAFLLNQQFVHCAAFSPDGKLVVTGPSLCMWDTESGTLLLGPLDSSVSSISVSSDNGRIVAGYIDNSIKVWDAKTGECKRISGPFSSHTDRVTSVAFSHSGEHVVSGSYDTTVRVWDLRAGNIGVAVVFKGHRDWVTSVAFSPDESCIASGSRDNTIRVWQARTGQMVAGPFFGHSSCVNVVAFSPDGERIVSGSRDKTIRVWEIADEFNQGLLQDDMRLEDGWMVDSSSALLFWVPPWLRQGLYFPRNSVVICAQGTTRLDLRRFVHGKSWEQCQAVVEHEI
ncbi:hypothetical protein DFH07DRAFT_525788 [Mycena maculata]|uniref:NACHT domain-containing protein n=1 Tax=Mycena maculata TaxID=230809 RepID=A0AAD7IVY4_9AGAR|nr:hypothetical protein DFH07DRAFT_525788 [Mycena maculata]